ncbi:hypothetical protein PWT90_09795 [Aphanocladium album]|nr:hypothetical protein PWT90_09795 [Aphanocladium album]
MALPKYDILIQPRCDRDGISHLSVSLRLDTPAVNAQDVLCEFAADVHGTATHPYTSENLCAKDDAGPLPLSPPPAPHSSSASSSSSSVWTLGRDAVGPVTLQLEVRPRAVDNAVAGAGVRFDLCRDQGGLLGCGGWFLPRVPRHERFRFSVAWDLTRVPAGAGACWSYGEGPGPTEKEGPLPLLLDSLFMVGPMRSAREEHGSGVSMVYWFGDLPEFLQPVKQFSKHMVPYAYGTFEDELEVYGIFVRKARKGTSGHNFASSLLLQYSDERGPVGDADLISLLTHELTHNWLYMGNNPGECPNMWYIEGIAQFYALFLPVRAGFRGAEYFRQVLNKFLCAYYTNPLIDVPLRETETNYYGDPRAAWTPYMRGFVYLLLIDALLRQASIFPERQNPIDDVVMSITRANRAGSPATASTWLDLLYQLLGKEVVDKQYQTLLLGGILELSTNFTFPVANNLFTLKTVDQETFELGFDSKSLRSHVVEGLLPGSRAAQAGLKNGDVAQHFSTAGMSLLDFGRRIPFSVLRAGSEDAITGEFWPRSFHTVGSFEAVQVEQDAKAA